MILFWTTHYFLLIAAIWVTHSPDGSRVVATVSAILVSSQGTFWACRSGGRKSSSHCDLRAPRVGFLTASIYGLVCSDLRPSFSATVFVARRTSFRCRCRASACAKRRTRIHGRKWWIFGLGTWVSWCSAWESRHLTQPGSGLRRDNWHFVSVRES